MSLVAITDDTFPSLEIEATILQHAGAQVRPGNDKQLAALKTLVADAIITQFAPINAAVIAAMQSGHVSAAALDVCDPAPIPADSLLRSLPNVIAASHIASASPRAVRMLRETAARIAALALRGELLPNVVNGVTR